MKNQSLPFPTTASSTWRVPRVGTVGLLLSVALVLWYGISTVVLAPNGFMLAFWFVLTHLLLPTSAFSVGWLAHTLVSRTSPPSFMKLFLTHLGLLILVCVALPVPLAAINMIPAGQTTSSWRGRVTAHEQLYAWNGLHGSAVSVTSDLLSPLLRFSISNDDYTAIDEAAAHGELPEVGGSVVRGFLGVPIRVRLDPISSFPN